MNTLNNILTPRCLLQRDNEGKLWHPTLTKTTNWLIICYLIYSAYLLYFPFHWPALDQFSHSEFLINYQGGYLRRGLTGEILLIIERATGLSPLLLIDLICVASYLLVCGFFLRQFHRRGLCWWLIFSPFFCGYFFDFIRKDYLLAACLLLILYLIRNTRGGHLKVIAVGVIGLLTLMIHEAFLFWGFPMVILLLFHRKGYRIDAAILTLFLLAIFLIQCYFKGDASYIQPIVESWHPRYSQDLTINEPGAIGAIGWEAKDTFLIHLQINFFCPSFKGSTILFRILFLILIYYFLTNFNYLFSPSKFGRHSRNALSYTYIFSFICMLPMFTILSCDFGRNYTYLTYASFGSYLLFGTERIASLFPDWYKRSVDSFNTWLFKFIPPSRGLMWLLLLFVAITPVGCSADGVFYYSIAGYLSRALLTILSHIFPIAV